MTAHKLKVLQICHDYEGPFAGVCHEFTAAFDGHHVTTVFLRGEDNDSVRATVGGDEIEFFAQQEGSLSGIKWLTIFRMAALFRRRQFDLVIAHRYKGIYLAGIMSYFFSIPLILGVAHELNVFRRPTRALFLTFWRRKIIMLAISRAVANDIEANCQGLMAAGRIHVIGHGISEKSAVLSRAQARHKLGLSPEDVVFGSVGRFVRKKEQHLMIEAFAMLVSGVHRLKHAKLCLVGDGPRAAELQSLASRLNCEDSIIFAGWHSDAAQLLPAFDAFVFSSGDEEGFGIVLLEAMRARVPVIASDAAGPGEVMGETAITFTAGSASALGDAMLKLVSMPLEARENLLSEAENRFRANYTLAMFRQKVLDLPPVRSLLGSD